MDITVDIERKTDLVQKGPIEGIVIVNGRPQMERADMPTISFETIQVLKQLKKAAHSEEESNRL